MSNTAVGQLYKRIIDAVVDSSRVDFEETGVDGRILEQLQNSWQSKLSGTHRANFPWDPKPVDPSPVPAPIPKKESAPGPSSTSPASTTTNAAQSSTNVNVIKNEPTYDASFLALPQTGPGSYNSALNPTYAGQRAAQLLQQQFGSQANNSISAMQAAGVVLPAAPAQQRPASRPQQPTASAPAPAANQDHIPRPIKQENDLDLAQTDGAGDSAGGWDAIVAHRRARGDFEPMGRVHVDRIVRRRVEQTARRLEAGGLFVPLAERQRSSGTQSTPRDGPPAAFDGGGDDSDDLGLDDSAGEDAINSDLDDSDDGLDSGIEAGFDGDMILCLYDKVARVKNKWKCTLKDGVVTVNGKDYVFNKAAGEFEW